MRSFFSDGVRYCLRCFLRRSLRCLLLGLLMLVFAPDTAQAQAPSLVFGPNAISFFGGNLPITEVLTVVGDGGAVTFSATALVITPAGSNWLSVSPTIEDFKI